MKALFEAGILLSLFAGIVLLDRINGTPPYQNLTAEQLQNDELATQILAHIGKQFPECVNNIRGPNSNLARAIATVEAATQSKLEQWVERLLLEHARLSRSSPPNLSYGIMQMKPSVLRTWIDESMDDSVIIDTLLDECKSIEAGQKVLTRMISKLDASDHRKSYAMRRVLRLYNGQRSKPSFSFLVYERTVGDVQNRIANDELSSAFKTGDGPFVAAR